MEKVNLGIIGLGYMGKVHLRNCLNLKFVEVSAVADTSKKALRLAQKLGVKRLYTDYNELLRQPNIDAVLICLPNYLHAPCAIRAAEEHKHIFLEKPLARSLKEGREIVSAARKYNLKLMVGYSMRFSSVFKNLKRKIESGILGDIQIVCAVNIGTGPFFHRAEGAIPRPVPEWWFNKELSGGGALLDLGSHMINLTRWLFGEIKDIKAYLGRRFNFDFEDYAVCIANFESGTVGIINVGWFSQKVATSLEVYGTTGYAKISRHPPNRMITAIRLILGKTPKFYVPYLKEISHFVNCIREDIQPLCAGEDAIKDLEIITRAYTNVLE